MNDFTGRGARWWAVAVEAGAVAVDDEDPWATLIVPVPALTAAQRAVLAGPDDQPPVPRIAETLAAHLGAATGRATGNTPGDSNGSRPYRRNREGSE